MNVVQASEIEYAAFLAADILRWDPTERPDHLYNELVENGRAARRYPYTLFRRLIGVAAMGFALSRFEAI